ncbi:MAG: hypothetical protein ABSG07_13250 [Terriglobales bacterium]
MSRTRIQRYCVGILALGLMGAGMARAQAPEQPLPEYKPQFPGDPARSGSEAQALGYMRTVLRAEHAYKKKHGKYADSLEALAGTGSFTKRMAHSTDRGDYTASFRPNHDGPDHDGFVFTLTPKQMDSEHRSFYAEEDGAIHADDQKAADLSSPKIR